MSSSFPLGWEELNPVEWGNPSWRPQSGHGGGRDSNTSASHRDQDSGGGTGFRDRSAVVDGSSNKIHTIWQANSAPLKFNSHINMPISCETVSCRKVYSGLYTSSDLKKNNSLIAVKSDISSKVGSDGRSTIVWWKIYKGLNMELFNFCKPKENLFLRWYQLSNNSGPGSGFSSTLVLILYLQ